MSMMRRPDMGVGPGRFTIEEIRSRIARRRAEEAIAQREAALELQSLRMKNESDTKEEILAERKKAAEDRLKAEEQAAKEKAKAQGGEAKGKAKPLVQRTPINLQNAAATVETPDMAEMAAQGAAGGPAANQLVAQQSPVAGGNLQTTGPEAGPTGGGLADIVNMLGGVPQNLTTFSERETVSPTQTPIGIVPLRSVTRERTTEPNALSARDVLATRIGLMKAAQESRSSLIERAATATLLNPGARSEVLKLIPNLTPEELQQFDIELQAQKTKQRVGEPLEKVMQPDGTVRLVPRHEAAGGLVPRGELASAISGLASALSPPTKARVEEQLMASQGLTKQLQRLAMDWQPEFNTIPEQWAAGISNIAEKFGAEMDVETRERVERFENFRGQAESVLTDYVSQVSGAQVSNEEANRLRGVVPGIKDSPTRFKGKLDAMLGKQVLITARLGLLRYYGFGLDPRTGDFDITRALADAQTHGLNMDIMSGDRVITNEISKLESLAASQIRDDRRQRRQPIDEAAIAEEASDKVKEFLGLDVGVPLNPLRGR